MLIAKQLTIYVHMYLLYRAKRTQKSKQQSDNILMSIDQQGLVQPEAGDKLTDQQEFAQNPKANCQTTVYLRSYVSSI